MRLIGVLLTKVKGGKMAHKTVTGRKVTHGHPDAPYRVQKIGTDLHKAILTCVDCAHEDAKNLSKFVPCDVVTSWFVDMGWSKKSRSAFLCPTCTQLKLQKVPEKMPQVAPTPIPKPVPIPPIKTYDEKGKAMEKKSDVAVLTIRSIQGTKISRIGIEFDKETWKRLRNPQRLSLFLGAGNKLVLTVHDTKNVSKPKLVTNKGSVCGYFTIPSGPFPNYNSHKMEVLATINDQNGTIVFHDELKKLLSDWPKPKTTQTSASKKKDIPEEKPVEIPSVPVEAATAKQKEQAEVGDIIGLMNEVADIISQTNASIQRFGEITSQLEKLGLKLKPTVKMVNGKVELHLGM
jgi:hypothetical protein